LKKLVYSPDYKEKVKELKKYLDMQFGESVRKRVLKEITDRLHLLQQNEDSGVSVKAMFGVDTQYEVVFVSHQYVFYRVDADKIYIVNMYNEREDFMQKMFGIRTISRESEDFWGE